MVSRLLSNYMEQSFFHDEFNDKSVTCTENLMHPIKLVKIMFHEFKHNEMIFLSVNS